MVKSKCKRGRFQPLLVLYANPEAEPIHAETASRKIRIVKKEDIEMMQQIKQRSSQGKERKLENEEASRTEQSMDDEETNKSHRTKATKRKSFKKMVGSAFKKSKSAKSVVMVAGPKRHQNKYIVDHGDKILTVNGHDVRATCEANGEKKANETLSDTFESCADDDDDEEQCETARSPSSSPSSSPVKESPRQDQRHYTSPPASPDDNMLQWRRGVTASQLPHDKQSSQTHRLYKHQQHLKSIGSTVSEASDNDAALESPRSGKKLSVASEPVFSDEEGQLGKETRKGSMDSQASINSQADKNVGRLNIKGMTIV